MTKYRSIYRTILLSALVTGAGFRDAAAATPPAYHVTDLGTLGGTYSSASGINASGHVTGGSRATGDTELHAFLYDGTMHDLGTLGGTFSFGTGINAGGHVAGYSYTSGGASHAFLYDGTMHDLGTLGGTYSEGNDINDSGQVTGYSRIPAGDPTDHAFLWTPTTPNGVSGAMQDLGTLGGQHSYGFGINASGQVTGYSYTTGNAAGRAFLYDGTMHDLGTLGGTSSYGFGINATGQVTGASEMAGDSAGHAFLYDGTMHDLGTLGGTYSEGHGINASGQVIGLSFLTGNAAQHAFLYTSGSGTVDLNSLIDPLSGWELLDANAINDAGQITGSGNIGGQAHAFLLTPVPEPASLALLALGLPFLVGRNSRRSGTRGAHGPMTVLLKL